jgi:hypothetical protein
MRSERALNSSEILTPPTTSYSLAQQNIEYNRSEGSKTKLTKKKKFPK